MIGFLQENARLFRRAEVPDRNKNKGLHRHMSDNSRVITCKVELYRYVTGRVTRTNVSFFDPSPNDERTEHSCA